MDRVYIAAAIAWARSQSPTPREQTRTASPFAFAYHFKEGTPLAQLTPASFETASFDRKETEEAPRNSRANNQVWKRRRLQIGGEIRKLTVHIHLEGIGENKKSVERWCVARFIILCGVSLFMEEGLLQSQITSMDKTANVVLDIEGLPQQPDKCCTGSPKMTRALSRKGSNRMERRGGEEQEQEELAKKLIIKVVPSQLEQLKLPLVQNKTLVAPQCTACTPVLTDSGEGRNKRFNRFTSVHPRKILLFFATLSSVGSMILIYFTLAINSKAEA